MIVPIDELDSETLRNIAESIVLREGTDYGEEEVSFEEKVTQLLTKLKAGEVYIEYSELHESITLIAADGSS
ncbi:YheU family protein [Alteromonas oceanisediminis]|uniref:YheU family protein n=1 Tax=Alteromonas oceanisediminis TaxID=2836180 RepID=UPI001BDA01AF|nr:YheU family protein [Alteromonas oceanisediminis]MBT0587869.1 YheU family protein [Alteromonas oceanisediminis]